MDQTKHTQDLAAGWDCKRQQILIRSFCYWSRLLLSKMVFQFPLIIHGLLWGLFCLDFGTSKPKASPKMGWSRPTVSQLHPPGTFLHRNAVRWKFDPPHVTETKPWLSAYFGIEDFFHEWPRKKHHCIVPLSCPLQPIHPASCTAFWK